MIENFFPKTEKIKEPRSQQVELFDEIIDLLEGGVKKFVINAPTGIGKSPLGISLMNYFANDGSKSLVTSPLNALVDQYHTDFGKKYVKTIKGKSYYQCLALPGNQCNEGYCESNLCSKDIKKERKCNPREDYCKGCICWNCVFKTKLKEFKNSIKGNTNFTLFQMNVTNEPDVIIIDECDETENFIRLFTKVKIPEMAEFEDFEDHILIIEDWINYYSHEIKTIEKNMKLCKDEVCIKKQIKHSKSLEKKRDRLQWIVKDYEEFKEAWSFSHFVDKECGYTIYEPISTNRFLESKLKDKIVFQMSATPQEFDDAYYPLEVNSPFDPMIRPWTYKPLGKMSMRYRDNTIPQVAEFLSKLQGKTLVHCISYPTAEKIGRKLIEQSILPFIQVGNNKLPFDEKDSKYGFIERNKIVKEFKESDNPNQILLSVKLDRGVDFPESDIVNNVIAVLPWANPTEKLTKDKNKYLGKAWQDRKMAADIMQMYGRINRNNTKKTNTYIIDQNFGRWFYKNKHLYFHNWFLEAEIKRGE